MIHKKGKVQYGTVTIPYHIIKSKRIKTSEIIVDHDKVTIRTPLNKDLADIKRIMSGKASWILKKQREYKEITSEIIKPTFEEGSTLPYLGKNYPIKILRDQSEYTIKFLDGKFTVGIKSLAHTNNLQTIIRKLYEDWLMEKAESIFRQKVRHYSKKLGLLVRRVIVKRLRNRWGSMTKEGRINLNVNLLKAPNDVIDYIILHEICHLKGSLAQQRRYKPF